MPSQERKKKGTNRKPGENNTKTMDRLTRQKLQNQSSKTGTDNINQGHTYQMYNMITEKKIIVQNKEKWIPGYLHGRKSWHKFPFSPNICKVSSKRQLCLRQGNSNVTQTAHMPWARDTRRSRSGNQHDRENVQMQ